MEEGAKRDLKDNLSQSIWERHSSTIFVPKYVLGLLFGFKVFSEGAKSSVQFQNIFFSSKILYSDLKSSIHIESLPLSSKVSCSALKPPSVQF